MTITIDQAAPAGTTSTRLTRPAPGPTLLSAREVTKSYAVGRRRAEILHGVSLGVAAGEMCSVMGPSGSGKSTLLYCLAGLEQPTTGSIDLLGRNLATVSRGELARLRRSEVGFVFQSYNLVPTLSVGENVALPWRLRRLLPPRDAIREAMATLGIESLARSLPISLSGGEQQRVALARVLAQSPRVVFADEPTGALDTTTGHVVLDQLAAIAADPQRAVLIVTHDPNVAARCDRVMFMRDGRLERQLSTPSAADVALVMAELSDGSTSSRS
jgi:putative ABC transport system ATP-binding protein